MQRVVARAVVLGIALLVGVVLAEVAVRLFAPQVTMFPRYVTSSEFEIELTRNARIRHARGGQWSFTYTTNELGRRGAYLPPEQVGDRQVVAVLGDSFSFGVGVDDGEAFAERLSGVLGSGWFVLNGGMGGWGLDSQIKWFYSVAAPFRPQTVVLQFTDNDPLDTDTGVTSVDADGTLSFHPYPTSKPAWQEWISKSGLLQRSHLFSLLRSVQGGGGRPVEAAPPDPEAEAAAERAHREVQERYVALLEAFATRLFDEGVVLHFVSVTHRDDVTGYEYDLDNHPVIADAVRRLDDEGLLGFVALPLDQMRTMTGSPEGHQWGPEHHRTVADRLATALLAASGSSDEVGSGVDAGDSGAEAAAVASGG